MTYFGAFQNSLVSTPAVSFPIHGLGPSVLATPSVDNPTWLRYRDVDFQKLGRRHEYTFTISGSLKVEALAQFYRNNSGYWRLFAYNKKGMLFSLNLSLARDGTNLIRLTQRLKSFTRGVTKADRSVAMDALSACLRSVGISVSEDRVVDLGTFDVAQGTFVRTTPRRFIQNFMTVALIKGHFMGNKGYELPGLPSVARPGLVSVEASLAEKADEADEEGEFDPTNEDDARDRVLKDITRRRGQSTFRKKLLAAYGGKCAISGCDFEGALEAAHIMAYRGEHTHHVKNGLLLRADLHTLFDLKYIVVESKTMTVRLSDALRGTVYEELDGQELRLPKSTHLRPHPDALDHHRREAGL